MKAPTGAGVRRWGLAGAALCGVLALSAVAVPALAGTTDDAAAGTGAVAPPPLDRALLSRAIAGLPNATVTGALVSVNGSAGRWSGTSGVADIRSSRPVPADARFRIASATKMFTAVITLQLAAEHRLDVDQTVQHYLPGLLPASYPAVTVGELLNHTSGLPESLEDAGNDDPRWVVEHRLDYWTPRQVVASATAQPMAFAPGTEQRYNGVNYFIAGMIIERVTGHPYGDELNRRILLPLGLRDTSLPAPGDNGIAGPHAHGYVTVDGSLVDVTDQSPWGWAESGIISTSADLTRFVAALFSGRLLPPAQLADAFTAPDVPYTKADGNCRLGPAPGRACFTMGLEETAFPNGVTVWGKSGGAPGYSSAVFATRDLSRVMVYDLNATGDRDGSEGPYIQNIAAAAFDPDLSAG